MTSIDQLTSGSVTVLGIPSDENSTFLRGAALAPARIREALYAGSTNLSSETGIDLAVEPRFQDLGDLDLSGVDAAHERIEATISALLDRGAYILSLGGDHAVTYPIVRAYAGKYPPLQILHLDAHPDLYDAYQGNPYSHACPFARIMEAGLASRLVQVGIRTMNPEQRSQAERFGVEVVEMKDWRPELTPDLDGPTYLSFDMDALDPAFAPGVSHHEPGGLTVRDAIRLIQSVRVPIVGADIVELNPQRDPLGTTAMVAAKLLKEIAAGMLETNPVDA
ncbi:MAG: agmatinase [bacterium]|nr:agmatinase [bacterium]